jgi:solute carrier family 13 (sodium-dependent dicarboxylate transporter), member 2/3/5
VSEQPRSTPTWFRFAALLLGPALALVTYWLLPESYIGPEGEAIALTHAARATLAVMVWMAAWWLTEPISISATALLPIALFPLFGVLSISEATAPYASELLFLFGGGFILALSTQRWGLDKRLALITLRIVGTKPVNLIGGFMIITAVLSMWVSNTATAAMMLPIAISVIDLVLRQTTGEALTDTGTLPEPGVKGRNFSLCLLLGIAYAGSIGGMGTIIGSPPNGILVEFLRREHGLDIGFAQWMLFGLPIVAVFLPLAWLVLTRLVYPLKVKQIEGGRRLISDELARLGRMNRGEKITMFVFFCMAGMWMFRPLLERITIGVGDEAWQPLAGLTDGGIAIIGALALFVLPVGRVPSSEYRVPSSAPHSQPGTRNSELTFAMDWLTAKNLPWGILLLFGGGLSLAAAVQVSGVAEFFGAQAASLHGMRPLLLILIVAAGVSMLTNFTSNTATTAALVPVLAGVAPGLGVPVEMLVFPAALAASCAFMMPVGTPPNAIIFGSGYITIPQMVRAGFMLNIIGVVIVTAAMYALVLRVVGMG